MQNLISHFNLSAFYLPLGIALLVYLALWIVKNVLIHRLKIISATTENYLDDLVLVTLEHTRHFFITGVSLYAGFNALHLDKRYGAVADRLFLFIIAIQVIIWGKHAINGWMEITLKKKNDDPSVKTSLGFLGLLIKFVFFVGVFLFVLNNLGVNISTFIAGLGVGGIAIALATQNILGDLFSSLSIVMDKPFVIGDFVNLGDVMGSVEHVGLKTTRIRSLSGEQIIVSNSDLLKTRIRNYKRMSERRVTFILGVTYATKRENLKAAIKRVEEIIRAENKTRFDRAHFLNYGPSSLDVEVVYWMEDADFNLYADTHQRILFAIHESFEKLEVEFAFPTQSLFINRISSSEPSASAR